MKAEEMWQEYLRVEPTAADAPHEAWRFGSDDPDALAALTLAGIKTATASAYPFYPYEHCPLPKPGDLGIVENTAGEAVCIIKTTRVTVVPFLQVSEEQAYREGEGDRSLAFWRRVHTEAFTKELKEIDTEFSEQMDVVCEEFERVYPR